MTWTCIKCRRALRREPVMLEGKPFGPVCAQSVAGRKAKREKVKILCIARATSDERQTELDLEGRLTQHYLSSSCGNDSVAMMIKAVREGVPNITVTYCHTGWASQKWAARIELVKAWALAHGCKFLELNKDGLTFEQLIESKKGFPMPGKTWCSLHLKAIPFLTWADEIDPNFEAVVMIGKRRDESIARRETPEYIESSEHHGGRRVWHPLAYVTEAERNVILTSEGFEILSGRSEECTPCVNANRGDMVRMEQIDIDKTLALESRTGQNMFRPYHHMGANGFEQVIKWAHSPRGKYEPPEIANTCTEGYCE